MLPRSGLESGDVVFVKKKPSAFHGTPLLAYLIDRSIDTLVMVGGATSNCVRATVFDSASYNFRTIVPGCGLRPLPISHAISLFDMDRQFADCDVGGGEVIAELRQRPRPSPSPSAGAEERGTVKLSVPADETDKENGG